jgi:hypothetical protein
MNPIRIVSLSLLTLAITACGGGGGSPDGLTETVAEEEEITEEVAAAVTVGTPNLGRGIASEFVSSELQLDLTSISSGGTSNITASVVDITKNNELITSKSYSVKFNSTCADKTPAKATFSAENNTVVTSTGNVEISYTATGCVGADTITATLHEGGVTGAALATAEAPITVETAEFGAIAFVSNSDAALSFSGIANSVLSSSGLVTFIVTDTFGNPIEGTDVTFALSSQSAGATASLSALSAKTNATGEVATIVNAGTTHGLLSVVATTVITPDLSKPTETIIKETSSLPLSVSTGIAVQSKFSLSATSFNPNAYTLDGSTVSITARLADRFGNFVPAGTVVNFTTESGGIPSSCITSDRGECSVDWGSLGTRPGGFLVGDAGTRNSEYLPVAPITNPIAFALEAGVKGFTTITAYAIGEAGYTENNSNGVFDIGETFEAYPETFRDDNHNGIFDAGEEKFEFQSDGSYSAAPSVYEGSLCSIEASNAGHCASNLYVTQSIRIVQTDGQNPYSVKFYKKSGTVFTRLLSTDVFDVSADGYVYMLVTDTNGNIPASGTVISFAAENYKAIENRTVKTAESQYLTEIGFPENRGLLHSFAIRPDTGAVATDLEVTIPGGEGKAILKITP